jgi:uncharacterized protein YegP (UPF0339 family)
VTLKQLFGKYVGKVPADRESGDERHTKILDALEWEDTDSAETLEERKAAIERELARGGLQRETGSAIEDIDSTRLPPDSQVRSSEQRRHGVYFEIVSALGGVRLNIKGDNHEILLQSEVYASKAAAENVIEQIQSGAATAPVEMER